MRIKRIAGFLKGKFQRKARKKAVPRKLSPKEKQAHKQFLREKRKWMKAFRECLAGKSAYGPVHPLVKDVVIKLNRLPFLYTFDSLGDRICPEEKITGSISIEEAKKHKKITFVPAFINGRLNPTSPHSAVFVKRLLEWKKQFPTAQIWVMGTGIEILAQTKNMLPAFEISTKELDKRLAESKRFIKALEKFVDEFRAQNY